MTDTQTRLIHHPYTPPAGFDAPQPGVFKVSIVIFPSVAAMRTRDWRYKNGYTYGLHGTPTTFTLEERIATLEGGLQAVLVPSGLAAIANVALALLKSGDELLIPDNAYGPNKALAEGELAAFGITHQCYDAMDPADLASATIALEAGGVDLVAEVLFEVFEEVGAGAGRDREPDRHGASVSSRYQMRTVADSAVCGAPRMTA